MIEEKIGAILDGYSMETLRNFKEAHMCYDPESGCGLIREILPNTTDTLVIIYQTTEELGSLEALMRALVIREVVCDVREVPLSNLLLVPYSDRGTRTTRLDSEIEARRLVQRNLPVHAPAVTVLGCSLGGALALPVAADILKHSPFEAVKTFIVESPNVKKRNLAQLAFDFATRGRSIGEVKKRNFAKSSNQKLLADLQKLEVSCGFIFNMFLPENLRLLMDTVAKDSLESQTANVLLIGGQVMHCYAKHGINRLHDNRRIKAKMGNHGGWANYTTVEVDGDHAITNDIALLCKLLCENL
ncbi:MAG: lipase family protein [Candidatus Nomurabacteria bacterium]|jgi:hypothetical protein|nr:lipase family protein [Candidatus Nomurabacteria bacterium]